MDQRTSPTRRICRQFWYNLSLERQREILSRGEWSAFTSLDNLPPTHRCGGRHCLSGNEGNDVTDDANVGEVKVANDTDGNTSPDDIEEDDDDDDDDADDGIITQPPNPIVQPNDDGEGNCQGGNDYDNDDDNYDASHDEDDDHVYDSDGHLVLDKYHADKDEDNDDKEPPSPIVHEEGERRRPS